MTMDAFKAIQAHNHAIADRCTILEDKAVQAITAGDMTAFKKIITEIDALQAGYKPYNDVSH